MTNEEIRGAILRITYDAQEAGRLPIQTNQYLQELALDASELAYVRIANAIDYLEQRGYLQARGIGSLGRSFRLHIVTGLTARGIDQIEGRATNSAIVQNVQVIGNNYGQAVQQGSINISVPSFPGSELRKQLEARPEAMAAVDEIELQLHAPKPIISKLAAAIETLKALTDVPGVVRTVTTWASTPELHHFIAAHLTRS